MTAICKAQFEPAAYALYALKMNSSNNINNPVKKTNFGAASAPRSVVWSRIAYISGGIRERSSGKLK